MFNFGSSAPERVPTDTVVPFHFFNDTPLWRAFILYTMFSFDDVLDPEALRSSLDTLARREGWRKLAARLRRGKGGTLEYHIPAEFSEDRPAITYIHTQHDMPAADHPLASQIPRPSSRPATVIDPDIFWDLFRPEGSPMKIDDYLNSDLPQIGLHVISFTDRTVVTIFFPHTLGDAMAQKALLDAWLLVLNGRASDVVAPRSGDSGPDPLAELGMHPEVPHELADRQMGLLQLGRYGLGNALSFVGAQENRMMCVPGAFISRLRSDMIAELEKEPASADGNGHFLSEGDVLCAWCTRLALIQLPPGSKRTVMLQIAKDMRDTLKVDLFKDDEGGAPYLGNAIGFVNVLIPANEVLDQPLSHTALAIRRAVTQLGSRPQIEAFTALWRQGYGRTPPIFGDPGMLMLTYTNWCKAKLFELDFSAAIRTPGVGNARPGIPKYIQNNQSGLILPNGYPIIGKDADGNFWLSSYLPKGLWAKFEEELEKY